jgi:hypothetical protein
VFVTVDRHPDVVQRSAQDHYHFGVFIGQSVISDYRGFHAGLHKQANQLERNIGHDADMNRTVIAHVGTIYRINIRAAPELMKADIAIDGRHQGTKLFVSAVRHMKQETFFGRSFAFLRGIGYLWSGRYDRFGIDGTLGRGGIRCHDDPCYTWRPTPDSRPSTLHPFALGISALRDALNCWNRCLGDAPHGKLVSADRQIS